MKRFANGRTPGASRTAIAQAKARQARKVGELKAALTDAGHVVLDEQARALGRSRSTAYSVLKGAAKTSGISATIIVSNALRAGFASTGQAQDTRIRMDGHTGTAAAGRMSSRSMYPQPWDGLIGNAINDAHLAADERRSWAAIGMLLSPTDASTLRRLLRRRRCHRHGFGCRGGGWSGR